MKIVPVASPQQIAPHQSNQTTLVQKAVEAFKAAGQTQETPVINPSKVSPEEMTAITTPTQEVRDTSTEAIADASVPESKPDPAISRQFAQLAKQERALRQKVQQQEIAIKAREAAISAKEAELNARSTSPDLSKYVQRDRIRQDALSVLDEVGVSYDELTQQIITRQPTDPRVTSTISRLENKIAELEKANKDTAKSYEDNQQQQYQAAVKQIELDTKSLVRQDPNFETIKATNSVRDVVELITETYKKDGVLLTVEEACQQVEDYLVEEATKLTRISKIKARLEKTNSSNPAVQKQQAAQRQQQPGTMKTLTNNTASSRQLSAKERAILAFRGELKP